MRKRIACILSVLLLLSLATAPAIAEEHGIFGKLRLALDFIKDPGLIIVYIKNEWINPILHKDPYSRYQSLSKHNGASDELDEPEYMKTVRDKLNGYFAKLTNYTLTDYQIAKIEEMGVRDVTFTIMDNKRTYYLRHIYISGNRIKVDGRATPNMVSMTPQASYELVNLLDKYYKDGYLNSTELKALGNWGLQKYKDGEISGKKSHIEAILNFLLVGCKG